MRRRRGDRPASLFTRRALMLAGPQVAPTGLLAAKLYQVQVVEGARYAKLAESNRISARLVAPTRGRLLDRGGAVLAGNKLNWRALLIAEQTDDVAASSCRSRTTSGRGSSASCAAAAASSR